jgi:hypothetical protein
MKHKCEFVDETEHGFGTVMVHPGLELCEVGQGCVKQCRFSYTPVEVTVCPTCKGDPLSQPNMICPTCYVFGIVRKEKGKSE